jgi:hypothetical protein
MMGSKAISGALACALLASPAAANDVGENVAWQFQTSADKVNQAAIQDMIRKRKSGYYAPPLYTTNIEHQYNCNVSATAQGNLGTNSNVANSPTTSGSTATATGNDNHTHVDGQGAGTAANDQDNSGRVGSSVDGATYTHVHGSADQALNSEQTNSGDQYASVDGASACQFGLLN